MVELLRTNDLVLISFIEALLAGAGIECFVADQYMSAVEGSLGFLPRRILVREREMIRARQVLRDAGLEEELKRDEREARRRPAFQRG
ncbi:MAG: DUF2007 domain-containing protein [Methylobacteriaceae bacterium]|nr:DUF2007 domain-containing protein [Methylobacteriaceae bacterium]